MSLRRFASILVLSLLLGATPALADRAVVLVTHKSNSLDDIDMLSIRKAYLAVPVQVGGQGLTAIRRKDDEQLNKIFMQAVVAMSEKSYERRLLLMALKFAAPRPLEVADREEMLKKVTAVPSGIAYMWLEEAEADSRVKIIRVLWQEH